MWRYVLGVDEAGRGPLAGPVAVGVVAVARGFDVVSEFPGVRDSKQLTELAREKLFEMLKARALKGDVRFRVCYGSHTEIDAQGMTLSVRRATRRGVIALAKPHEVEKIYLDGLLSAPREYAQETIIKGDELVPIISLASIAAKVSRDRLMKRFATHYPAYGFERHKGYPTKAHYEALAAHGPCKIHRHRYLHLAEPLTRPGLANGSC